VLRGSNLKLLDESCPRKRLIYGEKPSVTQIWPTFPFPESNFYFEVGLRSRTQAPLSKGLVRLISPLLLWHHPLLSFQVAFENVVILSCPWPLWEVQVLLCDALIHSRRDQNWPNSGERCRNQQHSQLPLDTTFTKPPLLHEKTNSEASFFGYRQYLKSTLFPSVISKLLGACFFKVFPAQLTPLTLQRSSERKKTQNVAKYPDHLLFNA
jgi:hypothetical protein